MGALQIAHDVHIFPVGSIAVLLYRFGRHMDGDVARLEYHRYGLWLGCVVVHVLQATASIRQQMVFRAIFPRLLSALSTSSTVS